MYVFFTGWHWIHSAATYHMCLITASVYNLSYISTVYLILADCSNKHVNSQASSRGTAPVTIQSQSTQKKAVRDIVLMLCSVRLIRYAVQYCHSEINKCEMQFSCIIMHFADLQEADLCYWFCQQSLCQLQQATSRIGPKGLWAAGPTWEL
jgi:hypothetical protein